MKKALSAFLFLIFALAPHVAVAQQTALAIVVQSCGTAPYTYVKGQRQPVVQDVNGNVCTTAAVTASISGFHAESSLTPITATTGGVSSSSFTAGKTILVSNTGLTNTAYCSPGASATTASAPILPGQSIAITTVAETAITCITSTSTTAVSFQVGTGLATGWGGSGGGGGGGGAITAASGAYASGSIGSGAMVDFGKIGNTAGCAGTNTGMGCLYQIDADIKGPIATQATSVPIGGVSNDPCSYATKINKAISMTGTTTVKLVSLVSAQQIYICALNLRASAATVWSIADGTKVSTECDTSAEAVIGSTTATHGLSETANGGNAQGGGTGTIARTTTAAHDLCLFQSGSGDLSGNLTYVQQ